MLHNYKCQFFLLFMCRSGIEEEYTEKEQLLQEIEDLQREYNCYQHKSKKSNSNLQKLGTQARNRALKNVDPLNITAHEFEVQELMSSTSSCAANTSSSNPMCPSPSDLVPTSESVEQEFISFPCLTDTSENTVLSSLPCSKESQSPLKRSALLSPKIPLSSSTVSPIKRVRSGLKTSTLQFLEEKNKKEIDLQAQKLQLEKEKLQFEKEKFELEKKERETKLEFEKGERQHNMAAADQQRHLMEILLDLLIKSKKSS